MGQQNWLMPRRFWVEHQPANNSGEGSQRLDRPVPGVVAIMRSVRDHAGRAFTALRPGRFHDAATEQGKDGTGLGNNRTIKIPRQPLATRRPTRDPGEHSGAFGTAIPAIASCTYRVHIEHQTATDPNERSKPEDRTVSQPSIGYQPRPALRDQITATASKHLILSDFSPIWLTAANAYRNVMVCSP
jgi:hypothetical protein